MSLIKKIKDYYKNKLNKRNTLFTTPSHEQGKFLTKDAKAMLGEKFYNCDFSEIEGFDNLRTPNGILKSLLDKLSAIYNSKQTFILTNGSSSGVITMMMSTLKDGEKVLIARNCHISVFNALVLTGAVPVWFMPEYDEDWGIYKGITAENVKENLKKHSDIKAVVVTSPTYEGLFSDISGIAKACKEYGAKLLVDEAHGALLNFGNFKTKPAILCGADMSVQSLHKTAGAPNPCALLHISKTSSIKAQKVQDCLNMINTTSPSYPLILATEICVDFLNSEKGESYIKRLLQDIENIKAKLPNNIEIYSDFNDPTKILLKIARTSGTDAAEILNEKYFLEEEFSNDKAMLFICGIGTSTKKLNKLFSCIRKIKTTTEQNQQTEKNRFELPKLAYSPREAIKKDNLLIDKEEAIGKVCAETIIDYPPGIPLIFAGEIITKNTVHFIKNSQIKICK